MEHRLLKLLAILQYYYPRNLLLRGDDMGVLIKNADITIYNSYIDPITKLNKYRRTVIEGINWSSTRNATISNGSVTVAFNTTIVLDKLPNYLTPLEFNKLVDKTGYFTLNTSDRIVQGNIPLEITKLTELTANYDSVVVMSVSESKLFCTLKVECKW